MRRLLLLVIILACRPVFGGELDQVDQLDESVDIRESETTNPVEHYHYHPTGPEAAQVERNADSLILSVPRHGRRGLTATMSFRYRRVDGTAIIRLEMSPGLSMVQSIPPAVRGPDGEFLWFGLAGPMGSLKIKARIDASVPAGTALLIHADLFETSGHFEQHTETIVAR